jgi:hypothetical protein
VAAAPESNSQAWGDYIAQFENDIIAVADSLDISLHDVSLCEMIVDRLKARSRVLPWYTTTTTTHSLS